MHLNLNLEDSDEEDIIILLDDKESKPILQRQKSPLYNQVFSLSLNDNMMKIYDNFIKNTIFHDCPIIREYTSPVEEEKNDKFGAFGSVILSKYYSYKTIPFPYKIILKAINSKYHKDEGKFLFNRYLNFCKDMKQFYDKSISIIPYNVLKMECKYCAISEEMFGIFLKMERKPNHFKDLNKLYMKLTTEELDLIYAQLYIILRLLNDNKIWHNDVKPSNILIAKTIRPIKYNLGPLTLQVSPGNYYPILIDYDLYSLDKPRPAGNEGTHNDMSFFIRKITLLGHYDKKIHTNFINLLENKYQIDFNEKPYEITQIYNIFQRMNLNVTLKTKTPISLNQRRSTFVFAW